LAGQAGSLTSSFYGGGTSALGNQAQALSVGANALNNSFSNQLQGKQFEAQQDQAFWGGVGKLAGSLGSAWIMSDPRIKEDTEVIGALGDLPLHVYRYKGDPSGDRYIGFMADEVEKIDPSAIHVMPSGYKAVDYGRAMASALGA
jgi:hypothetical protein